MPNLEYEIDQLRLADAHIATAEKSIVELQADMARQRELGADCSLVEEALRASLAGLVEFRRHRDVIASTIEGIENGTLPSS